MSEKSKHTEELALTDAASVEKSESIADLVRRMLQLIGEDPERDAKRFRRTEQGICLITQPMIDRLSA